MKSIEFFGVSNSGKTFNKNKLKKKFLSKKTYDYRSIILNFSNKKINLSLFDYLTLFYFKIIKSGFIKKLIIKNKRSNKLKISSNNIKKIRIKNLKKNYFYINYKSICQRLFIKLQNKNKKFYKFTFNVIDNLKCDQEFKKLLKFWFVEEYCAYQLIRDYRNIILLDSEGFIQRLLVYIYFSPTKNHYKIINNYLNLCPIPNHLLITKFKKNKSIIKKNTLPEILDIKKENEIFKKIKFIIYKRIKTKKMNVSIHEINNKMDYDKIKL
tara:strand:- start:410 stop:1213 length:804 start_codon:yes stop_codon:yes gene_type:complete